MDEDRCQHQLVAADVELVRRHGHQLPTLERVVGLSLSVCSVEAFYWTTAEGMKSLGDVLTGLGVNFQEVVHTTR